MTCLKTLCSTSQLITLLLGVVFITLGSCRVLLIKFSANEEGKYEYLPVSVNVAAEFIKLVVCSGLSIRLFWKEERSWRDIQCSRKEDVLSFVKWAIPGLLYFIDNLIAFYIIKYFQPAMVVLLWNFGIISTSVLFRIVLKRKLSRVQWCSLGILFLSIVLLSNKSGYNMDHQKHHAVNHLITNTSVNSHIVCQAEISSITETGTKEDKPVIDLKSIQKAGLQFHFHTGHLLILVQCVISSLANIYNEKIFKEGNGMQESIYVQNSKLYLFGVIFNSLSVLVHGVYRRKVASCGLFYGHNKYSVAVIFITAIYGLTIALILKFKDNMFYLLSAQITTVVMVVMSIYFFDFKPDLDFFLTAPIVLFSILVYNLSKTSDMASHDLPQNLTSRSEHTKMPHTLYEMQPLNVESDDPET
ncbi:probable UDP-sugar transporter protein SLC35A5 [Lingula anatina]|uniref:Probable UDP-sugar transporter protein SLC35A5 n=1 Tax=Lingula anatina TaxID=7574 RepID=A0A1S3IM23_LINAN|nr:probable UDP-sugar transporter protein SLC35A5 [Lingula anatina]XP_013398578.1 probable UDP-sugar transporter protein SLC35A5 [Lingula anatina]XP_013398579.1 probable UDP-sugar transporter protein SLC35A5 [Lingula anatina]XP_013398580.1 probable UDP-sugar transporter protein SLC35A5 [Lingula anatina]XP_013398581.1 probable UDP-sugar transporter protein SLC35A5 [Lingula anatina]XP_013398582.1 probable UDP-sugar transporter protein SLC35A5 [Lingula anatina]|eukprot:XP_013398577.1 probable UDP-sugar transporter protein SLC35A5 [Lingula anatina]